MATEPTEGDSSPTDLLAALSRLRADRRGQAAEAITALTGSGYSMRKIARETGIPRTTLHRWVEATP